MRGAHHVLGSDFEPQLHRDGIEGHRQSLRQGHRPKIFMAVVLRLPSLDVERPILPDGLRRQTGFDRGEINERLEGRTRLTLGRQRAVILAVGIIAPAHHGAHRAIRRDRHQRALADVEPDALGRELVNDRGFSDRLQLRIDGGFDHYVLVDLANEIVEHFADPVCYVIDGAGARRLHIDRGTRDGGLRLRCRDVFCIRHRREHDLGTFLRALWITVRRQPRWRLHQAREHRGLGQRDVLGRFTKIALRGGLNSIGAGAEINPI